MFFLHFKILRQSLFLSFIQLLWCIKFLDLYILTQPYIAGMNLAWSRLITFLKRSIYLFEGQSYRGRNTQQHKYTKKERGEGARENPPAYWFHPQTAKDISNYYTRLSQEPGASSWSPLCVQDSEYLSHFPQFS